MMNAPHIRAFRIAATVLAFACLLGIRPALAADAVTTSTAQGYARLLFSLRPSGPIKAALTGAVLKLTFERKVDIAPASLVVPGYVESVHVDPGGKSISFALNQPVRLHTSSASGRTAIDLVPQSYAGTPPDLPPPPPPEPKAVDIATLPPLTVRAGAYHNFTRVVFDWSRNVPYTVFPGAGHLTVRFEAQAKPDFSAITREQPPWVKAAGWHIEGKATVIDLETDSDSGFHDFRDGTHVVIDVLAPKTDADAYNPPGDAKPTITKFTQQPADKKTLPVSAAQVKAIDSAAAKLNTHPEAADKPATAPPAKLGQPTKPADTTPPPAGTPATGTPATGAPAAGTPAPGTDAGAQSQAAPAVPDVQDAASKLIRNGAVLTFPGAGRRGSAVFIRGMTAWIVLQNAAPLNAAKLKAQLGTFPDAVDAASSDNISVLRLTLKQPEQIAAIGEGSTLKVIIAPQVNASAIAIGFSRNQDSPGHSSLSTLLPGATNPVTLVDPVAGDQLIVIPGAAGRAMLNERNYVDFAVLQTASGMVLEPYVDDLSVAINQTRVTITHPGGLDLTPPTMPLASTPQAMAEGGSGPCFLDFADWKKVTGGSFLATERRLRMATARLKPEDANHARLALARFYLANHFAAETLGLLDIMQSIDPALQSDMQLQTMRAAADYDMGRYRDAHNAIAGTQFDADRNAALWRGLIEAALEDWNDAHTDLDRAGPVLSRYQPEMQARVRIANAQAALGIGRLEIADAQVARLPARLPKTLALQADLVRARLYAAENRHGDANRLFATVETAGDDHAAAQAIYYRVGAALSEGTMSTPAAVNALERLRFRWRGDILELDTLRKLASLYFSEKQWRNGLRTLRIATQNFPNDDQAGKAQDDMRAAFVNLFLKGQANAMPPVEALALFYDFIDLTPIGPDGDEMIRHMADRLVAVDLLGPAEDLLHYQVTKRLDGIAAAQVATRLAMIQLMDHKPQAALDTLNATRLSTLPDDVLHQRLLLQARALAEEKQYDQALDLIAVDQAPDTVRLRADIYWESGNWALAAQKAEESLGTTWSDAAPLSDGDRQEAMRAAVAYSLANDEASLERIRDHFGAKMKGTPDGNAFAVVTTRIDMHGLAFRDAAAKVASIDTLTTFMQDLQKNPMASD
ncbi:MAG: hypothetical protein KGJ28_13610 [Alphaproteobacteria bacterium]|nr:hypothetical protein [Alphaproteobacteria bacterium]